jgi:hypothetical protein
MPWAFLAAENFERGWLEVLPLLRRGIAGLKGARTKLFHRCCRRATIPGANILTNVATKDVPAQRLAKLLRNGPAKLDG